MPTMLDTKDLVAAASALAQAAASGEITPAEAADLSRLVVAKAIEVADISERLRKLEQAQEAKKELS
jgi:hypothetical protein